MKLPVLFAALFPALALAACQHTPAASSAAPRAGIAAYVGDAMVKPYYPDSGLVTPVHHLDKPKYPAIDIHCHWSLKQDPHELLKAMDDLGVERANNLSGGWGDHLDQMLHKFHDAAPDRLLVFCNIDLSKVGTPTFGDDVTHYLEDAHRKGASGLKFFKNLGLTAKDTAGKLIPVDDPRLAPVWDTCARLKMPILIHTADPIAFFEPIDEHNERWMQLKRHPDWSFFGPQFPSHAEVQRQFLHVVGLHPHTVFISAHLVNDSENLEQLSHWLDEHPNLYTDLSGRVAELGRQPYAARRFLLKYQDRIMFGTDRYPGRADQPRNRIYYRFLETADEYFNYYDAPFPPEGEWRIYGVYLPDGALKKIYHDNAARALKGELPLS